jgi:hypothetical protein
MATQNIFSADSVEGMHFGRCEKSGENGKGVESEDLEVSSATVGVLKPFWTKYMREGEGF